MILSEKNYRLSLFFFGDSICFGQGVSIHKGWVTRVAAAIDGLRDTHGINMLFSNASLNGNTTRLALERMPYDVQTHSPTFLLVQFGMNDCNFWQTDKGNPRVSPKAFKANLEEIIQRALTFGTKKIFLNTNHPTLKSQEIMPFTNITYQENNVYYNCLIREVAQEFGSVVELNDLEKEFDKNIQNKMFRLDELLLPDCLHLSELGHNLYFEMIYPKLKKYVLGLKQLSMEFVK